MLNSTLFRKAIARGFKLAFHDIETSPPLVYTYPLGSNITVPAANIVVDKKITSIGYKFHGEKTVTLLEWDWLGPLVIHPDHVEGGGDDKQLLRDYSKVIIKAHIVVGQNGDSFDNKEINWRMNDHKLKAIMWPTSLDTYKLSKKTMRPTSHKLDYRSKNYGFGGKIKQDMDDCISVARGNLVAQRQRVRYNGKDVKDLEKIFWRELDAYTLPVSVIKMLKDFIRDERPFCMRCAGRHQKRYDVKRIKVKGQFRYKCDNCDYMWRKK